MIDSLIAFSIWLSEINSEKILLLLQQGCNIIWLIDYETHSMSRIITTFFNFS